MNTPMDSKNALFFKASRNALKGPCGFTVVVCQQEVFAVITIRLFGQHSNVFMTDTFFNTDLVPFFVKEVVSPSA